MKIKVALIAGAVLAVSGCASQKQVDLLQQQLTMVNSTLQVSQAQQEKFAMEQTKAIKSMRPTGVCYLGGQPYTQGAVVAGRICDGNGVIISGVQQQLSWKPYSRRH